MFQVNNKNNVQDLFKVRNYKDTVFYFEQIPQPLVPLLTFEHVFAGLLRIKTSSSKAQVSFQLS